MNKEDLRWLTYTNNHWQPFERSLLENANNFRAATARLSAIVECYAQHIAAGYPDTQHVIAQRAETAPATIHAMTAPISVHSTPPSVTVCYRFISMAALHTAI
ncbi:hypothetical protein EXD76_06850 [BEV proteobacterium]|nr:hypothetical protein [Candidatus Symbiopectobacterium sp. Chty_BC]